MSQDWFALQVALAPCLIGYGDIAKRLYADPNTKRQGNIYWKWIENYVADDYSEAVRVGSGMTPSLSGSLIGLMNGKIYWNAMQHFSRRVE
jgi:thiaminase